MPVTQVIAGARGDAPAGWRAAASRRALWLAGAIGMMAVAAAVAAAPALAGVGSEPGNVRFSPASGATNLAPTWSTTDGCPAGYRGSAQMSIFDTHGKFLSSISNVAYNVTGPFSGNLDGNLAAILRFAHVSSGGSLEFAVGCYSQTGGTGNVRWLQSTLVTLGSDGSSFTSSKPSSQQVAPTGPGANGTNIGVNAAASAANAAAHRGGGLGAPAEAALIAGACLLAAGGAGYVWYRRRNRSQLF